MSFTNSIKERIAERDFECDNCSSAYLAALMCFAGGVSDAEAYVSTESERVAQIAKRLIKEVLGTAAAVKYFESQKLWRVSVENAEGVARARELSGYVPEAECCRRSYLAGAFLGGGGVSDPKKGYHLEMDTKKAEYAASAARVMESFGIHARIIEHKSRFVVYIKDYESVADVLGLIGADFAALELFSVSVEKQVRNEINRQVNCESANMKKLGVAASQQIAAINKIEKSVGLGVLSEPLREIAAMRIEHPEDSLKELGERLSPQIGKSGVNHRLARIIEFAKNL